MWKLCVDKRDQRRMTSLAQADRKATATKITTLYNHAEQKNILKALKQVDYNRPLHVPVLSTELKLQRASPEIGQVKDWKKY